MPPLSCDPSREEIPRSQLPIFLFRGAPAFASFSAVFTDVVFHK
jgi:hypothetical protein